MDTEVIGREYSNSRATQYPQETEGYAGVMEMGTMFASSELSKVQLSWQQIGVQVLPNSR